MAMDRVTGDARFLPPQRPPRKPGQEPTARLTLDAYVRLARELEELTTTRREAMSERLLRAREHGDIRENADYEAAKNEQGLMESRIRELEHLLKDPDIVEAAGGDHVGPGTLVTLRPVEDGEDEEETYLIAHSAEERAPGVRTMTPASPLGSALLGKGIGDQVTYEAPGGRFTYEVVSLQPHHPS
jgi:transcription elongation factor GreA